MPFGAFAQIIPGIDGLIYISQISTRRIERPSAVLSVGEEVQVKIVSIDCEAMRVNLSIRALIEDGLVEERVPAPSPTPAVVSSKIAEPSADEESAEVASDDAAPADAVEPVVEAIDVEEETAIDTEADTAASDAKELDTETLAEDVVPAVEADAAEEVTDAVTDDLSADGDDEFSGDESETSDNDEDTQAH